MERMDDLMIAMFKNENNKNVVSVLRRVVNKKPLETVIFKRLNNAIVKAKQVKVNIN